MVQKLRETLCASLIERDAEIDAILLGLVAREHVLLVGPPGTGKSMLCRSVAAGIAGMRYCERLLSPTSPPESVFGPISLSALREDRYEHVGAGTVTDAELVFLDEFFRGSDSIRDTLLHLLGPERQALVGTQQVRAPLMSCVGASNSWSDSADQAAILDRWLIRRTVRPISPQGRQRLLWDDLPIVQPVCNLSDVVSAGHCALRIPISADAKQALHQILDELSAAGIRPSDRRCRASVGVARAAAVLDNAAEVQPAHLECLKDVLWDDPHEQPERCNEIVTRIANPVGARINSLLADVDSVVRDAGKDAAARMVGIKKLEESEREAQQLAGQARANGRAAKALQYIQRERVRMQAAALGIDPAKAEALLGNGGGR